MKLNLSTHELLVIEQVQSQSRKWLGLMKYVLSFDYAIHCTVINSKK